MPNHSPFRDLPFMGVIRVNNAAMQVGWKMGDPAWTNLGQGQPEVGELHGAPPRFNHLDINPADHAYGPVEGIPEYRQAVADHYNRLYRKGKSSQYTLENVAIAPGGRAALTRIGATLDRARLGYFTPDYTAYEDLFTTFTRIEPVHIELHASHGFRIDPAELDRRITTEKLAALLISNPCNPTGVALTGPELAEWVSTARARRCTMIFDEFYSHYIYNVTSTTTTPAARPVSAAEFVEDVNTDPILIVDGLTKNYRYPGWRSGWVVAPKSVIHTLTAGGSFLDGGPSRPIQRAAIEVLKPARADQETDAVRQVFAAKHRLTIDRLTALGIEFPALNTCLKANRPTSTFYAFGSIAKLPKSINTGEAFMHEAFKHQVLTVPGQYFDVNPGKLRSRSSPLESFVRFSFGPPKDNLSAGLDRLAEMVRMHMR